MCYFHAVFITFSKMRCNKFTNWKIKIIIVPFSNCYGISVFSKANFF